MSTLSLNLIQQQHVLNKNILIADYLSSSSFTTVKMQYSFVAAEGS